MRPVIIYPPTIDWDQLHQRPQQLLKALSRYGAVSVFCNLNLHKRHTDGIEYISPALLLTNGMSLTQTLQWVRGSYPESPVIIYYTYPPHIPFIRSLPRDLLIFDSVDEPADEFVSWHADYATAVDTSDVVLVSAVSLLTRARQATDKPVHLLPNGCDFGHFRSAITRQPLPEHPFILGKPVIGYIGAIAPWLDWQLINTMAHSLPGFEFVFIGSPLLQHGIGLANKNMHYLGHKDYQELPRYLSNFSYCLIPFKLTCLTMGVNPVKFWEYLASGLPILTTALPEIPHSYATIISEDMFPGFLPEPDHAGRDARIRLAEENSWDIRAQQLLGIIRKALEHG